MAFAGVSKNKATVRSGKMPGKDLARLLLEKLECNEVVFSRSYFHVKSGEERICATVALASEQGKLLLCLPSLLKDETHEQKYIIAEVDGSNFMFSLPYSFGSEHKDLHWILHDAVGRDIATLGGGKLRIDGKGIGTYGKSGDFNINDVNMEAGNILAYLRPFWDAFAEFREKNGFLG